MAVCAAVAHGPVVLLADEPTGELDRDSAHAVYALLARAADLASASLVLVTHDVRAAEVADRVVRIRDGRLSEEWEPAPGHAARPRRSWSTTAGGCACPSGCAGTRAWTGAYRRGWTPTASC